MAQLTRSQHPDLRLFTQVPGKLGWLSNKSYKTYKGASDHLNRITRSEANRRGIIYLVVDLGSEYRVLAKAVSKKSFEGVR